MTNADPATATLSGSASQIEWAEAIRTRVGGRVKKVPALEVLVTGLRNSALQGDLKAGTALMGWLRIIGYFDGDQPIGEGSELRLDRAAIKRWLPALLEDSETDEPTPESSS